MSYPQGNFFPQSNIYPQGNFGSVGYPHGIIGQGIFGGYPQQPFGLSQGPQQPFGFAQGPTQQPFGQPFGQLPQQLSNWGAAGPNGVTNAGALSTPPLSQQPQHQLLLQLAQYHYFVAQQLTQLATQQAILNPAGPYAGQFLPGQMAANFVPGITMH
jgi:hypothetical protein